FLPKRDLLTLEELDRLCTVFIEKGVKKLRLTGGEPLVRKNIMHLVRTLSRHLESGALNELTLTTNGTQLFHHADVLASLGVKRINVSLDTLDDAKFEKLTRRNRLSQVLRGLDAAQAAGLKVKINTVALKGVNEDEIAPMIEWAHGRGMDLTLIEVMPLGEIEEDRTDQYLPLTAVEARLAEQWSLTPLAMKTGGPARYMKVQETGGVLGMITPLTNNFCAGCNRVRVTCTGEIYMCLGHGDKIDLRAAMRGDNPQEALDAALDRAMLKKPERHAFEISERGAAPAVSRHMSVTGG
ncbi:GTP 3',8-cyclase MoaA, partial [Hyphococcus sp.]|uniref:GTP 3',8-cyclase MoaA n=1 Tax=Hyphococcus sp. TaxID=2038636 RepID=UPI0035C70C6D